MYAPITIHDFRQNSQSSAHLILGARSLFLGVRNILGKFVAYSIGYVFFIPFILTLKYTRYRIRKKFPKDIKIDSNNYADIRKAFDISVTNITILKQVSQIETSVTMPIFITWTFNEIKKIIQTLEHNNQRVLLALHQLDAVPSNTPPAVFQQIKETDLWAARPKSYQYRV